MRRFISNDIKAVLSSTCGILYFEGVPSWGSAGEITVGYSRGVPFYTIVKEGVSLESVPSWVIGCSYVILHDIGLLEGFDIVVRNYQYKREEME
jgi:hypothetical protein